MAAGYQNLYLEQGASFAFTITLDDVYGEAYSLSGANVYSKMRYSYYTPNVAATFATTISANTGQVTFSLDSANTANITPGRYVYDAVLSFYAGSGQANTVIRILEGIAEVAPGVTSG